MNQNARIFVRFSMVGFHCWATAPHHRAYLREHHRHLFHVIVETEVEHDQREIEFHDLLDEAQEHFSEILRNQVTDSCEAMARKLGRILSTGYRRVFCVTVSEDGECGANVTVAP